MPIRARALTSGSNAAAPATARRAATYASRYIDGGTPREAVLGHHARRGEQPAEALVARLLERHASDHHLAVQLLEKRACARSSASNGIAAKHACEAAARPRAPSRAQPWWSNSVSSRSNSTAWIIAGTSAIIGGRTRSGAHGCVIHFDAMPAVVIAATNLMPSLQERLADEGELLTFADTEPIQALQAILEQRPSLIVLERLFAATPRGAALINRIKTDPQLGNAEVRVMSHTGDYTRQVAKPSEGRRARRRRAGGRERRGTPERPAVATAEPAKAARLARHAPRAALPRAPRRRDSGGRQSGERRRSVDRRRAGAVVDDPAAEPEGAHQHPERRVRDALPRRHRVGQVRAAQAERRRRATAPASTSPTPTPPRSTTSAPRSKSRKF